MTYISRKTRLLVPRWFDECDPAYLYRLNRKRSDGRLKRHDSCDDLRAWVDDQYLNYQYLLELMTDGEFQERQHLGVMGRIIPVEYLLDVLCGNALHDCESHDDDDIVGSGLGKLGRKPRQVERSDVAVNLITTDDVLKITNAAMSKLENISNLIYSTGDGETNRPHDGKNYLNLQLSGDTPMSDGVLSKNFRNREEYLAEYNDVCRKISCLKQRLGAINKRKEEYQSHARLKSSRQTMCRSSSGMTVTELYSREEQMHTKRIQKKIEKLIQEKGHILNEMCEAMKYLNELKKKLDPGEELSSHKVFHSEKENFKKPRERSCLDEHNENEPKKVKDGDDMSFSQRKKRDVENSDLKIDLRKESSLENSAVKHSQHRLNDSETIYLNIMKEDTGSSEAVLTSGGPLREFQKTQQVSETIGDIKSKSESTVNDLEQILRSYEQRLSDLGHIEVQVEELKKRASMASYFKKRWLRCTTRGRVQKLTERTRTKEELKHLYIENSELKKLIVKLTAKSEKEQNEIQYLKCKHKQMSEMEEEMLELKKYLKGYQVSFETQRECIESLENTVTVQRDRIENLMTHIKRLSGVAEAAKETGGISKKYPRNRSHGPECKKNLKKTIIASSEESLRSSLCCCCCDCTYHPETPNRPRSECTRRTMLVPQTWRRQSCNN